jgi:tRNA A37 methylthiotransferase MiaB
MATLTTTFTSTGEKLFYHQEAMQALRDGSGKPIHAWLAAHDICNHKCAFCSVGERAGDVLSFNVIKPYFETLAGLGLKAVTLSGGGNSILYKCRETGADFNDLVDFLYGLGLQIGVITNGMPMIGIIREMIEWKCR